MNFVVVTEKTVDRLVSKITKINYKHPSPEKAAEKIRKYLKKELS